MKRKGWLIPILVFILSFSILFFYQKEQNTVSLATVSELPPILWSLSPTDISKVVYSASGSEIIAMRQENIWVLSNFDNKHADNLYIYTIIGNFVEPSLDEVIEISPANLTQYGIDENSPSLSLYDTKDNEYTLVKGHSIDVHKDYVYAPSSKTVYALSSTVFASIKSTDTEWRNKQLLDFKIEDVAQISFSYKSVNAILTPVLGGEEGNELSFTSSQISDSLASEFINFLQSSKIEQFISDNAPEHVLSVYGFNTPSLTCTISLKSGGTLSLEIGNINKSENICYATVNKSNNIVAIPYFDLSQFSALYAQLHGADELALA